MKIEISPFQIDQLKEIMNIGASHASTALSQMVEQPVDLTVPSAHIDTIDNIEKYFANPNDQVRAVLIKVFGDINGLMYFLFSHKNEQKLIDLLLYYIKDKKIKKELEASVVEELGNVLVGASLTAFSKFLDLSLLHSFSKVFRGSLIDVVKKVGVEVVGEKGVALMFEIDFSISGEQNIDTNFMFFIDAKATETLLHALKLKY